MCYGSETVLGHEEQGDKATIFTGCTFQGRKQTMTQKEEKVR